MGVSPTGYNVTPVGPVVVTNAAWVRFDNPNMAHGAVITADTDVYVRWEQPLPAPGATGMRVWANTYYPNRSDHWLGYSQKGNPLPAAIGALWVRAVAAAANVYVEWRRE